MCLFILIAPNPRPRSDDTDIQNPPQMRRIAKLRQRLHHLIFDTSSDDDTLRFRRSGACSPPSCRRYSSLNTHPPNPAFEVKEDDGQDSITLGSSKDRPSVLINRDQYLRSGFFCIQSNCTWVPTPRFPLKAPRNLESTEADVVTVTQQTIQDHLGCGTRVIDGQIATLLDECELKDIDG
jgi:hypothetical protein